MGKQGGAGKVFSAFPVFEKKWKDFDQSTISRLIEELRKILELPELIISTSARAPRNHHNVLEEANHEEDISAAYELFPAHHDHLSVFLFNTPHHKSGHARLTLFSTKEILALSGTVSKTSLEAIEAQLENLFKNAEDLEDTESSQGNPETFSDVVHALELLHPRIIAVSKSRFDSSHFADAVEASFKELNNRVKTWVFKQTSKEYDGTDLMRVAINNKNPIIKLCDLSTESGRNEQEGYGHIFAGSMLGIRNPKAHGNLTISEGRCLQLLFLASLLMSKLDDANVE